MVSFMGKEPEPDKDGESVQEFYRTTEALFTTHPLWQGASPEELESSGEVRDWLPGNEVREQGGR